MQTAKKKNLNFFFLNVELKKIPSNSNSGGCTLLTYKKEREKNSKMCTVKNN